MLPEIRQALSQGRSLKGFYLENQGRLRLSYSQLCRYVQAFSIRAGIEKTQAQAAELFVPLQDVAQQGEAFKPPENPPQQPAGAPGQGIAKVSLTPRPQVSPPSEFHYDPMDVFNHEFN